MSRILKYYQIFIFMFIAHHAICMEKELDLVVRPWNFELINKTISRNEVFLPNKNSSQNPKFQQIQDFIGALHKLNIELKTNTDITNENLDFCVPLCLGSGCFGEVFRLKLFLPDIFDLAVKQPIKDGPLRLSGDAKKKTLVNEIAFLNAMNGHPNIMEFYGSYPVNGMPNIVLEMVQGDWANLLLKEQVDFDKITSLLIGAGEGLAALHAQKIVHCDIRPANLFWVKDRGIIGDFSLARAVDPNNVPSIYDIGPYLSLSHIDLLAQNTDNLYPIDIFAYGLSHLEMRLNLKPPKDYFPIELEEIHLDHNFQKNYFAKELISCCASFTKKSSSGQKGHIVFDGEKAFMYFEAKLKENVPDESERELIKRMLSNDPTKCPTMNEYVTQMRQIYGKS